MIEFDKYSETKPLKKNYLDYVGTGLLFSTIPDFDNFENAFFAGIKEKLPFKREIPKREFQFQVTSKNDFQASQKDLMQYIYEDNQEKPTIRLVAVNNALDFQCLPLKDQYEGFGVFLDKIIEILDLFFEIYNEKINLSSLILRKVNKFPYNEYKDRIGADLLSEKELFGDNISRSFKEIICSYENKIIEIRNGILPNNIQDNKDIIFDYIIKINNSTLLKNNSEEIKKQLVQFNLLAYNIFTQTIGENFFNDLKRE